jgi:hypothetical protein
MTSSARELFSRIVRAIEDRDLDALDELVHPDFVGDFLQSGERIRGVEGWKAQAANYPGGMSEPSNPDESTIIGDEERWAISPNYTVVPLAAGHVFTTITRSAYPDGSTWHVLVIAEVRDGKIYRADYFFAPELSAPLTESMADYGRG